MYLLENVFTNEHGEAITVLQLLTKFKSVLSEIDTYLNEYGNRLNSIEFKNVEQDADILILKSQVASLQTKVNNIQLTLGDYLLRFQNLDIQLSVINDKITNNTSDISNLNALVSTIQTSITDINNQLNTINLQIPGINTRVDIALSSISDIGDNIDVINTTLSTQSTAITTISNNVNDLTTLVNNLQNTCATLTSDLNSLTSRVLSLETNDIWQNEQISYLTTLTQLNTNNVSALNTLVGNINDDIDALELLIQNSNDCFNYSNDCFHLESSNSFEISPTSLEPTNVYNLWEYPANVDTDKTLVNIQTSFSTSGDTTQISIHTPNGPSAILPTSFGSAVNPATLNIDFMYKITNNVMEWYGVYTLLIKGKYPIINYFSADTNYPHKETKTYPLANTHLAISFSAASIWLQPHVKITKYKLGG